MSKMQRGEVVLVDRIEPRILLVRGDKSGVSKRLFYRRLIEKADKSYAAHLASLRAKKKGKR